MLYAYTYSTEMPRDRSTIRRLLIRRLLADRTISSQSELGRLLEDAGHAVTQATVSRDLAELGAVKTDQGSARERYTLVEKSRRGHEGFDRVRRVFEDNLEAVVPSGNLVVLRVRVATANAVAAAIDDAPPAGVIATLAGDDTVLVVADDVVGGQTVAQTLMGILED